MMQTANIPGVVARCTEVLCRLLRDSGDVCRDLVRSVSRKREQAVWFARRLLAKSKETRHSMSLLFATIVCSLDVTDCLQSRPGLAETLADVSSDELDDDDLDDEHLYGLEAGETKKFMERSELASKKKKNRRHEPPSTVASFLLLLESIQQEVMEKHLHNDAYFDLYFKMCCLGEKNSPHILRAMYDHEVISALVHL
jgi:hypothetical protein